MRNVHDPGAAEAPPPDDDPNATYPSVVPRRSRRRRQAMIGAAGLLTILGAGALVAGQVLDDRDTTRSSQADGLNVEPPPAPAPEGSATPSSAPRSGATPTASSSTRAATTSPAPASTTERVQAARSASAKAKATAQVFRPLPDAAVAEVDEDDVTTTTVRRDGETVRVMSARADLTGYRELAWTVDDGIKFGDVRCTSKVRLSKDVKPRERPTLLLCWRTSSTRSVYTVAVKPDGRPSAALSATTIDQAWDKLG
ncbi:hypothetical protein GCM10020358_08180 [Amorphoplanes nipponensis]|uniref:Uncharacterized protein n=1 Tax=Actinoplanes nipponensis TaxID=135950 RepID=A0A919JCS7_9ACTN|nr:hypothetical protein [Actinoplanes nipponensis]GIE48026.1 hypothetical protein Ani05nite_15600 [Actinoplanes nipponensis]